MITTKRITIKTAETKIAVPKNITTITATTIII